MSTHLQRSGKRRTCGAEAMAVMEKGVFKNQDSATAVTHAGTRRPLQTLAEKRRWRHHTVAAPPLHWQVTFRAQHMYNGVGPAVARVNHLKRGRTTVGSSRQHFRKRPPVIRPDTPSLRRASLAPTCTRRPGKTADKGDSPTLCLHHNDVACWWSHNDDYIFRI